MSLIPKADDVVWDNEQEIDTAIHKLCIEGMRFSITPYRIYELESWAHQKAKEHREKYRKIDGIMKVCPEATQSLLVLREHHNTIANRYSQTVEACANLISGRKQRQQDF